MKTIVFLISIVITSLFPFLSVNAKVLNPIGKPGYKLTYVSVAEEIPGSVVRKIELTAGAVEEINNMPYQWLQLVAEKESGQIYSVWILSSGYPSESLDIAQQNISRYILSRGGSGPVEYVHQNSGNPVFPATGVWKYLFPRFVDGNNPIELLEKKVKYLGIDYILDSRKRGEIPVPPENPVIVILNPDLLIGIPHNTKMVDETRKWDDSDYEYVRLTEENYFEMIEAGINCFRVDAQQAKWIEEENVYYWGIGGEDVLYPECLYQSNYIGPVIFFDEPMVGTRDYVIRPKFKKDPTFRKSITPQKAFDEFKKVYHKKKYEEGPTRLINGLADRDDVDIGIINFLQENIYSWETMVSSAIYQLSEGGGSPPNAMVFEPPGRFGAKRVLPELNMSFDCQIPVDDPKNLSGIIYGFLRGAARLTDKQWGMSVYGQVDRSDAYWFMTHAYDQGGTLFFFWDTHRLAAVPYSEYLALTRNLRNHADNFPARNLEELKHAAEVAIVIPVYYNLGHVKMGIGNITGLPELNLERENSFGVKYRTIMSNFLVEIERCIRLGVEYDLFWDLEGLNLNEYREIVKIRNDGRVEVLSNGESEIIFSARIPGRPDGVPPELTVKVASTGKNTYSARALVNKGSSQVFYTQGADSTGIHNNQYVLWELYGPDEEDYTDLWTNRWNAVVTEKNGGATVDINFNISKPGSYRLRVSATDLVGRSKVVWKYISIPE